MERAAIYVGVGVSVGGVAIEAEMVVLESAVVVWIAQSTVVAVVEA